MGLTRPTHVPTTFDFWDNDATRWPDLFRGKRRPQRKEYRTSTAIENGMGTDLLRFYAEVMSHTDFDVMRAVQNTTEFKHGGAINVALNQDMKLGFIWNYRPIVPRAKIPAYRAAWKRFAHVPSKEPRPDLVEAFLAEVVPMLGDWSCELARGYGSPTATGTQTGSAEAEEELGVRCTSVQQLTLMGEDNAQNPAMNDICLVRMDVKQRPTKPVDLWEKIAARAEWVGKSEYEQAVRDGLIVDPYTPMGIEMLRIFDPETYAKIAA